MDVVEPSALLARPVEGHDPELAPAFDVVEPSHLSTPLVLSSPHSGSIYPRSFLASARLSATALRRSEDAFVDDLFSGAVGIGAPLLRAHFPRAYLDLNREPFELDPRMFDGRLPNYVNARSVRVAGGLGTIARIVGDSQEIYARRLGVDEGIARIHRLYFPYHEALQVLLNRAHRRFGVAILIDCHSMPSLPAGGSGGDRRTGTDMVIGDRYGTSSGSAYVEALEQAAWKAGFGLQRNKPYAGGYITENYGRPAQGFHAIQIEIKRSLYMDERALARLGDFASVKERLTSVIASLAEFSLRDLVPGRLAAE